MANPGRKRAKTLAKQLRLYPKCVTKLLKFNNIVDTELQYIAHNVS